MVSRSALIERARKILRTKQVDNEQIQVLLLGPDDELPPDLPERTYIVRLAGKIKPKSTSD